MDIKQLEAVDKHLTNFKVTKAQSGTLSSLWNKIKPIVVLARGLLFFKPNFQKEIDAFIAGIEAFIAKQ